MDFAARSIAMLPFEPGRFSTTTAWPTSSESRCPTTRAEISGAPPGRSGTTRLIGREGYCAHEASENTAANASAVKRPGPTLMCPPATLTVPTQWYTKGSSVPGLRCYDVRDAGETTCSSNIALNG